MVKTHGPNVHPITESTHAQPIEEDDQSSQSKINHYSENQEHILLTSDFKKKDNIVDLNHVKKSVPSLVELKPYAEHKTYTEHKPTVPQKPQQHHYEHSSPTRYTSFYKQHESKAQHPVYHSRHNDEAVDEDEERRSDEDFSAQQQDGGFQPIQQHSQHEGKVDIQMVQAPDLTKFKPISPYVDYKSPLEPEIVQYSPVQIRDNEEYTYNQIPISYPNKGAGSGGNPGHAGNVQNYRVTDVIGTPKSPKAKVKPLINSTPPGLKPYSNGGKSVGGPNNKYHSRRLPVRSEYSSYFRRPAKSPRHQFSDGPILLPQLSASGEDSYEQRAASTRMVQALLARKNRGHYNQYY